MKDPIQKQEFLVEAWRINAKLAAVIDGEGSYPTLYALLALAVHCADKSNASSEEAVHLFQKMLENRKPFTKGPSR
jgi:hypothetical protein